MRELWWLICKVTFDPKEINFRIELFDLWAYHLLNKVTSKWASKYVTPCVVIKKSIIILFTFINECNFFSPKSGESEKNTKQGQSNSSTRPLSIEGPSTSSNVSQPLPNQPRQPTNLQGLLKYAMDAAQSEDTENKSPIYPLDEEV